MGGSRIPDEMVHQHSLDFVGTRGYFTSKGGEGCALMPPMLFLGGRHQPHLYLESLQTPERTAILKDWRGWRTKPVTGKEGRGPCGL